jgi:hypothetical protein
MQSSPPNPSCKVVFKPNSAKQCGALLNIECEPMFVETIGNSLKLDLKEINKRKWSLLFPVTNSAGQTMTDLSSQIVSESKKEPSIRDLMCRDSLKDIITSEYNNSSSDMHQYYLSSKSAVQKHMPDFAITSWKNDEADSLDMIALTANKGSDLVVSCMAQSILFDSCTNIVLTDMIVSYFTRSYDGNTERTCEKIGKFSIFVFKFVNILENSLFEIRLKFEINQATICLRKL